MNTPEDYEFDENDEFRITEFGHHCMNCLTCHEALIQTLDNDNRDEFEKNLCDEGRKLKQQVAYQSEADNAVESLLNSQGFFRD